MPRGIPLADWNGQVLSEIKRQLKDFEDQKIVPTLRSMFYTLVDLRIIPKTAYHALSEHTSRWRESGILPIDCFADHIRNVIQDFDDDYETIEEFIERVIDYLRNTKDYYTIPRWHQQPNYLEVWLEKDSPVESIRSIVKDRHVRVVPNRGHSSVAFLNDNVNRLKERQAEGKKIYILYLGDADPSGEVMDRVYERKLLEYGLYDVKFIRLAVTEKQINRFRLLHDPDPETLKKLKNDSNKEAFKIKWNLNSDDELFAVQLEAMLTPKVRSHFKRMLLHEIDKLFDQDIYIIAQAEKPSPRQIDSLVLSKIRRLLKEGWN
jgi:hypothetical protein